MSTDDLSEFGQVELNEAITLLAKYKSDKDFTNVLGEGVKVWFNQNSGGVFLSDENYNTAMLDDCGTLRDWIVCPICGSEGFLNEIHEDEDMNSIEMAECKEWWDDYTAERFPNKSKYSLV